jgi:hypothetical protein
MLDSLIILAVELLLSKRDYVALVLIGLYFSRYSALLVALLTKAFITTLLPNRNVLGIAEACLGIAAILLVPTEGELALAGAIAIYSNARLWHFL